MHNYSKKHNILFVHIPKNAGTSILNCLEIESAEHYPLSVLQGYIDKETFDNAIKIAVVRNPWERMASYYRYRQLKNQDPKDFPFDIWLRSGSIQYNMSNYDSLSQIKWCAYKNMAIGVDYIFNFEKLGEQWEEFCQIENIPNNKIPKLNTGGDYDYTQYYNKLDDIVLVNHFFRADVEMFEYHFGVSNDFPLLKGEQEIYDFILKR